VPRPDPSQSQQAIEVGAAALVAAATDLAQQLLSMLLARVPALAQVGLTGREARATRGQHGRRGTGRRSHVAAQGGGTDAQVGADLAGCLACGMQQVDRIIARLSSGVSGCAGARAGPSFHAALPAECRRRETARAAAPNAAWSRLSACCRASTRFFRIWKRSATWIACEAPRGAPSAKVAPRSRRITRICGWLWSPVAQVSASRSGSRSTTRWRSRSTRMAPEVWPRRRHPSSTRTTEQVRAAGTGARRISRIKHEGIRASRQTKHLQAPRSRFTAQREAERTQPGDKPLGASRVGSQSAGKALSENVARAFGLVTEEPADVQFEMKGHAMPCQGTSATERVERECRRMAECPQTGQGAAAAFVATTAVIPRFVVVSAISRSGVGSGRIVSADAPARAPSFLCRLTALRAPSHRLGRLSHACFIKSASEP
jgi:hypothetical protein